MARVTLQSSTGVFKLAGSCRHCAGVTELTLETLRLHRSTPLQLLAILPFGLAGTSLKDSLVPFGLAVVSAVIILHFGQMKAVVQTNVCASCRSQRRRIWAGVGLGVLLGFGLLLEGVSRETHLSVWSGIGLMLLSPITCWLLTRRDAVTLVGRSSNTVTLEVPHNIPAVWESRGPAL